MDKELWFVPAFCLAISAAGIMIGTMIGHHVGVEQALERVCNQTNGKYDFCQESTVTIKKYKVSIPDPCMEKGLKNELTEEEWQNCFGTPIYGMSKRNKK